MQREESPAMTTGLERIAAKARTEARTCFTSLAHHITKESLWQSLCHIPRDSAPGIDGQTVEEAKEEVLEPRKPRAVVSVAFKRDEFTLVVSKAREAGMTTSSFIRDAALNKARASGRVLAIYWGGSAIGSGSFVAQIDPGPRTQGLTPPSTFSYEAPAAATG